MWYNKNITLKESGEMLNKGDIVKVIKDDNGNYMVGLIGEFMGTVEDVSNNSYIEMGFKLNDFDKAEWGVVTIYTYCDTLKRINETIYYTRLNCLELTDLKENIVN